MTALFVIAVMLNGTWAFAAVVGSLNVTNYTTHQGGGSGGVDMRMNYTLNAAFHDQDCCDESDIRFIQRATVLIPIPPLTTVANESLIDPRNGQPIGPPLNNGDNLPWYDYTYPNAALTAGQENLGIGPFFVDVPNVPLVNGQMVSFETLVVCEAPGMMMGILGGVSWGFTITADGVGGFNITRKPLVALSEATPNLIANFNAALANDFPGWTVKTQAQLWPELGTEQLSLNFTAIPEPASMSLFVIGAGAMLRRRNKAA